MRASELLGIPVRTSSGDVLGQVIDVRLVQDGPLIGGFAALRIEGFVVGRHKVAAGLGYDRYDQHGPPLVRRAVRWLTRHNAYLAWDQATLTGTAVVAAGELVAIPPL